jgi:hypothetical protein
VIIQSIPYLEYPEEKTVKNGLAKNAERKEELAKIVHWKVSHVSLPLRRHVFNVYASVFCIELLYKLVTRYARFYEFEAKSEYQ